jgi:nicotinate-nucleotide adenylyltransferase
MVWLAIEGNDRLRASDIEFRLPTPSYTIDTLAYLEEKHPGREYQLVMGADGLKYFHKWKNAELIIRRYHRLIYPRPGVPEELMAAATNATLIDAPLMEISSSFIRKAIKDGKDMRYLIPEPAYRYIRDMQFYEK